MDPVWLRAVHSGGSAGEEAAMHIYAAYHTLVKSWIGRQIRLHHSSPMDPNDILHDAFIIMINKIRNGESGEGSITTFWYGIAQYLIRNKDKKEKKIQLVADAEEVYGLNEINPELMFLDKERLSRVEFHFEKCCGRCREVLLMWIQHYSMEEIAERLQFSGPTMARKIKYECFKKLKKILKNRNELLP